MRVSPVIGFILFSVLTFSVDAQNSIRQQIDSQRDGSFLDDKTYEKARGFIRKDSTYYVGHMLEGAYLFFRANDELGFRKAIAPLEKALNKIEYDFDPILRIRTNNYAVYSANYRYQFDYGLITYFLGRCYQNVELQDKAMEVLEHIRDRNFQVEINMDSYNTMAWIFHRNRVYTSKQFPFLKNSVKENVAAANRYLDSALLKIQNDMPVNNGLYDPKFINRQYLSTYHYKAMIHDYLLDIDSANYYYDLLIQNQAYSSNNYAEFKLAMGEFEEAELFFQEAEQRENSPEKTTKEYYYMRGTLATYRGHPEKADSLLKDVLQKQGSTPGFGWHCIGLARAQHYEGLTAESQERTNKAARFQELHIGTTWGQEQYNLAVASLNYLNQLQFKKEYWFEHNEWYFWLNPVNWYKWVKYTLEIRHHKMLLASLVAENPEREQVLYSVFSPENLIAFDEVWSVIEGFGNEYFIKIYKDRLATDKRPRVKKYFRYFLGKLYLAEGKESEAINYFQQVLNDPDMDDPYQTMLTARVYEGLALASSGVEQTNYTQQLYARYPQLIPFSDLTMSFRLNVQGEPDEIENTILEELRDSRIEFVEDQKAPLVSISFTKRGEALDVNYSVEGSQTINGVFRVEANEKDDAGKLLAYRLFNIQKSKIGERPPAQVQPIKEANEKPV
ncbi:MAG: tetratricopeptide repeat protein [Flammeovirgaceae bacterium]|nr:tetratricopeptide repeat protein [Flammeovirgaceae bacterium]